MLTFTGKPQCALIENYSVVFLKPFPPIYQLVTNQGFHKLAVHGVPCMCHTDGSLLTSRELHNELCNNLHLCYWQMLDQPQWTHAALLNPSKTETSFLFILCNNNNTINRALCTLCYMYGKLCKMVLAPTFIQHRQCKKCFLLTHETAKCPLNCPLYK